MARLNTLAESYNREASLKELRNFLTQTFNPSMRDCYQEVIALPPLDELQIKGDKVTLIIYEPHTEAVGLHPDLRRRYEDLGYKNRILFLSGTRGSLETLLETAAELKAVTYILEEMKSEKILENDPQFLAAQEMQDQIRFRLLSTTRETFTTLHFPQNDQIRSSDFLMAFTDNNYNGEKQIRETLSQKGKFTEDVDGDSFRQKCEQRLFTQKAMLWTEIKKRAATTPNWQWHRLDALDRLKDKLVHQDQWRENGGYIEKPPFPKPQTDIRTQERLRDDDTGEVTLSLTAVHGDTIYYEVGAPATTASQVVSDPKNFCTQELEVSFLGVDSTGEHETGEVKLWRNRITLKSRTYQQGNDKMVELKAAPTAPIRYTTDGSDPKTSGGNYEVPFIVPPGTVCILAIAEKQGIVSESHRVDIQWDRQDDFRVDPEKRATWKREHQPSTTKESYEFLGLLKKYHCQVLGPRISINGQNWIELNTDPKLEFDGETLEKLIDELRGLLAEGEVAIDTHTLHFPTGQSLLDWVAEVRTEIRREEVEQP